MEKKVKEDEEEEENGCEGYGKGSKPYKVNYRIITEGEEIICLEKEEQTLNRLIDSLSMKAWNLGDFNVIVLGKEEVEHIDG